MSDPVRVTVHARDPEEQPGAVESAYHEISRALRGTPGLAGNTLLRAVDDPRAFVVVSEWRDLAAFRAWEEGGGHRGTTASLRGYQQAPENRVFRVYQAVASY